MLCNNVYSIYIPASSFALIESITDLLTGNDIEKLSVSTYPVNSASGITLKHGLPHFAIKSALFKLNTGCQYCE